MALFGLEGIAYGAGICARAIAEAHPELGIVLKELAMKVTIELTLNARLRIRNQGRSFATCASRCARIRRAHTVMQKVIDQVRSVDVCTVKTVSAPRPYHEEGTSKQAPGA